MNNALWNAYIKEKKWYRIHRMKANALPNCASVLVMDMFQSLCRLQTLAPSNRTYGLLYCDASNAALQVINLFQFKISFEGDWGTTHAIFQVGPETGIMAFADFVLKLIADLVHASYFNHTINFSDHMARLEAVRDITIHAGAVLPRIPKKVFEAVDFIRRISDEPIVPILTLEDVPHLRCGGGGLTPVDKLYLTDMPKLLPFGPRIQVKRCAATGDLILGHAYTTAYPASSEGPLDTLGVLRHLGQMSLDQDEREELMRFAVNALGFGMP